MKHMLTVVVLLALSVSGCAYPVGPRESTGTLLGAGTGALIGSQIGSGEGRLVAVALGTLAGALIGQDVGRTLDRADLAYMQQNAQSSLETSPSYQTSSWINPDTGHSGSVTPTRTYQNSSGQYCREYQQTVVINGSQQQAYGTACRQPDGSWNVATAQPQTRNQVVVRERVVTPVYRPVYYDPYYPRYYPRYYPYYPYYPAYYWPFATSLSFSWVGHSGGHHGGHHGRRSSWRGGHGWRR
jgi:surface antigen